MAPQKRIFAFRHAQAEHNVAEDYSIPDAPLTPLGRSQASSLPTDPLGSYANSQADLIVTSPLRRTLQTTLLGFPTARKERGVPTICLPQLQECNDLPCDTGSSKETLQADQELGGEFDFEALPKDWNSKRGLWAADEESLKERLRWVRRWLRDRPERNIVVVAHGDALRYLTKGRQDGSPWTNVEGRAFVFAEGESSNDAEAMLKLIDVDVEAGPGGSGPTSGEAQARN